MIENNILECIKWMYVLYGIKVIYSILDRIGVKVNIIKHAISMMIGLQYAPFVFILGALVSFEFIEVKEIKIYCFQSIDCLIYNICEPIITTYMVLTNNMKFSIVYMY